MNDIYEQLRDRLEMMATGYPTTPNGVEIKILRQLFSEEDAALFLKMETGLETAIDVALRLGTDISDTATRLEAMARRGLIFRDRQNKAICYRPIPFIVGIYEYQLNNLSPLLVKDITQYYRTGLGATFHGQKTPHLRSIPINAEIVADRPIFPYDDAVSIINGKSRIALAECFCRKAVRLSGKTCSHTPETCLQFETMADYYVENKMARYISTKDDKIEFHDGRCIGCGLCVTACPAATLEKKPDNILYTPPETVYDMYAVRRRENLHEQSRACSNG